MGEAPHFSHLGLHIRPKADPWLARVWRKENTGLKVQKWQGLNIIMAYAWSQYFDSPRRVGLTAKANNLNQIDREKGPYELWWGSLYRGLKSTQSNHIQQPTWSHMVSSTWMFGEDKESPSAELSHLSLNFYFFLLFLSHIPSVTNKTNFKKLSQNRLN